MAFQADSFQNSAFQSTVAGVSNLTLQIWRTGDSAYTDYSLWLYSAPVRVHSLNQPQTLEFSLTDGIAGLVVPEAGNRIRYTTTAYGATFVGYCLNTPELDVLGADKSGNPVYGYRIKCVGESVRLEWSCSTVFPTLPPFINQTQGQIIKGLIAVLSGGFSTIAVDDGILVPYFRVKPDESFWDAVRRLSDRTNMKLWFLDGAANFKSYADAPFSPSPSESDSFFNPYNLNVTPVDNPVFNDVTGTGQPEPQTFACEHFVGDGITATFPLKMSPFGAQSGLLNVDDWTEAAIDTNKWLETDVNSFISLDGGSLQFIGTGGLGVTPSRITAVQGIEIAGKLELRAGRFRFNGPSDAVVGGLCLADSGLVTDCMAGFRATPSGVNTVLQAFFNGSSYGPQYTTIPGKSYHLIITVDCSQAVRRRRPFFSLASSFGGEDIAADARISYSVIELPDSDADVAVEVLSWSNIFINIPQFLFYTLLSGPYPEIGSSVNMLLNFTSLRKPVQCEVWTLPSPLTVQVSLVTNGDFEASAAIPPIGWTPQASTLSYDTTTQHSGSRSLILHATSLFGSLRSTPQRAFPGAPYDISGWARSSAGAVAFIAIQFLDTNGIEVGNISAFTTSSAWTFLSASGTAPPGAVSYLISLEIDTPGGGIATYDEIVGNGPTTAWVRERIGDLADPDARVSINATNEAAQIIFFSDRVPEEDERVRVIYRGAGIARARVQKSSSVTAEALKSGGSGVRSGVLPSQQPMARDSQELERQIQAYIDDMTTPLYQGDWTFDSKLYSVPTLLVPGRIIIVNCPTRYDSFFALVTDVTQTFETLDTDGITEIFTYKVTFGPLSRLADEQEELLPADDAATGPADSVTPISPTDTTVVGTTFASDIAGADFDLALTGATVEIDSGMTPTVSFEVRKTDSAWGSPSTMNKISSPTSRIFTVPRTSRDICVYIKNSAGSSAGPSDTFARANGTP